MLKRAMSSLNDKFRGCLVGALMGDCMGSAFEGDDIIDYKRLRGHMDRTERFEADNIALQATDDTEMTQELADSLIERRCFDAEDLARRFVTRYYSTEEQKFYGQNVVEVFRKLRDSDCEDPFGPATRQFGGSGSYGNGAAMRVAPVPMVTLGSAQDCADLADQTARITHTHEEGRLGAVFQALAVRRCLLDSNTSHQEFLTQFRGDLKLVGMSQDYLAKLDTVEMMVEWETVLPLAVENRLGNSVAAIRSVPTALFCFLRALRPLEQIPTDDTFRRTVEFAISLGGDTDTIASMAGAMAGANLGLDNLNKIMWEGCPEVRKALRQADALFRIHSEGVNCQLED